MKIAASQTAALQTAALLSLTLLLIPLCAQAGSANGTLTCKNAKKKITLQGEIPGDHAEFDLTLTVGKKSLSWSDKGSTLVIFNELRKKVLTLDVAQKEGPPVRLFALPETVKTTTGKHRAIDATFKATLNAPNPAKPKAWGPDALQGVTLKCTYSYSI